jgi:hypothetical protein
MNRSVALLVLVAASACAGARGSATPTAAPAAAPAAAASPAATSPASPAVASAAAKPRVICTMERPLGSNIAQRVCRTEEAVNAERQAAQDAIHLAPKSGPTAR